MLKIFKKPVSFGSVMNVLGPAFIITAIGNLLAIVLSVVVGKLGSVSPAILMDQESASPFVYSMLGKIDPFTIWFLIVISIGLIKVNNLERERAYGMIFGLWILYVAITSVLA